jgi:FkbM family methyltransferase
MRKVMYLSFLMINRLLQVSPVGYRIRQSLLVRSIYNFVVTRFKQGVAQVQGHKMFLDSNDTLALSTRGIYEPLTTNLFRKEINKGDIVLDIGAHIGYYTLISAGLVGEEGKVFAFEPAPDNFALLRKNIGINGYKNVVVSQKAVSNKCSRTKLFLNEHDTGSDSICEPADAGKSVEVDVTTLDEFFRDYDGNINFIKMDVEGAEPAVIEGMSSLLNKNKKLKMVTEFNPNLPTASGIALQEYLKLLMEHSFELFNIDERDGKIKPLDEGAIVQFCTSCVKKNYSTNLFCIRK